METAKTEDVAKVMRPRLARRHKMALCARGGEEGKSVPAQNARCGQSDAEWPSANVVHVVHVAHVAHVAHVVHVVHVASLHPGRHAHVLHTVITHYALQDPPPYAQPNACGKQWFKSATSAWPRNNRIASRSKGLVGARKCV